MQPSGGQDVDDSLERHSMQYEKSIKTFFHYSKKKTITNVVKKKNPYMIVKNKKIKIWVVESPSSTGGRRYSTQLPLHKVTTAKFCDTSKSWHHVLIWVQWSGKKWVVQFYSYESHPNPLNFTIAWFSTSKEYWKTGPFLCLAVKVPISLGLGQGLL